MTLILPAVVNRYFVAEQNQDLDALAACFSAHGVVYDEGQVLEGVTAIQQWMVAAKAKYQHSVEPIDVMVRDGKTVVNAKVSGHFPGSPVILEHIFELEGPQIKSLKIC